MLSCPMPQPHDRASRSPAPASRKDAEASVPFITRETPDPLSDVLQSIRLTGALFFRIDAGTPWGVEVPAAARLAQAILP